tara:strand:- start:298 stop:645 length:348 start_codon:yes stop_codon:yes gene_type:complete
MTTENRNIVELRELDTSITEVSEVISNLNETIVELNFIIRQLTMSNLDGEIKSVTIPASGKLVVSHRLKTIPRHRIILKQVGGGLITDSQFTSNYIELNNSGVTDANITIIILKE